MQRRHFELIAATIKGLPSDVYGCEQVAKAFADALRAENPRFDRARFLTACGIEESN
jgi:predicted oxidoreductase